MSEMIRVASGFQYSVNIAYDLNNEEKLKNFIPTRSALGLLEDILLSTRPTSTERARVLIGAYGKGKSHIILMILSILMKRDLSLFEKLLPKVAENERLHTAINIYYESDNKILPVIISGSNTSLPQAFLLALQRTLSENDLLDLMPETNYKAAISVIHRWKTEFKDTYNKFCKKIDMPIADFIASLEDFDVESYGKFERIYPLLTAGSIFNPFLGFDVVELYESVAKSLKTKGFTGIYVVYDEFSKFLEANISEASMSDTKMLQDFAEKCTRSGKTQMHLMLISHKEIANYIDILPKQKVDGWRGVSERFLHVHLNNNFTQTYEIIAAVIQKNAEQWEVFYNRFRNEFRALTQLYEGQAAFNDLEKDAVGKMIRDCYPLHPVSTFILPRLSERVAQNERTLFTFLSSNGLSTLPTFLSSYMDDKFEVITPDLIYDYFEPLLRKEVYSGGLHSTYILAQNILEQLQGKDLESKIVKTIALIYIMEQFEKLKPSKEVVVSIFSVGYSIREIETAINNLIEKELVIYLKRSNDCLQLKQTSGVDIRQKIRDMVERQKAVVSVKAVLNASNFDSYMYPSRYNDDKEITRYFSFEFIEEAEVDENVDWAIKSEGIEADGVIYAIIPKDKETLGALRTSVLTSSNGCERCIFIVPKKFVSIENLVREYKAVETLRDEAVGDKILFDEYEVIYEDLREVITVYINSFTQPERAGVVYIYDGAEQQINRKASLTGLMSDICELQFYDTPIINNEVINKNELTSMSVTSRSKILAGLLRNELEPNLGLSGTGQEVSIMRSTLIRTGILATENGLTNISLQPADPLMHNLMNVFSDFVLETRQNGAMSFDVLYNRVCGTEYHIGLRRGLIPIYLAAVFHVFKKQIVVKDNHDQASLSVDTLLQINANPSKYTLEYLDWNPEKESFVRELEWLFKEFIIEAEKTANSYDYVVSAMKRWYMSLPKYTKAIKKQPNGQKLNQRYIAFFNELRSNQNSHELLFTKLPFAFGYGNEFRAALSQEVAGAKSFFDGVLDELKKFLIENTKVIFAEDVVAAQRRKMSLTSIIRDWYEQLDNTVFEQLFPDGTDKCLELFRTITNDELTFITRLAKLATDLRIEDWDFGMISKFEESLKKYKQTAEGYKAVEILDEQLSIQGYQVTYVDDFGAAVTKRFDKVETSKKGELLYNSITAQLEAMGQSISEQEKRQILMDILKDLC